MTWATITTFIGLAGWISAFVMLFIIPVNRKPSSAIAWLLLIFLLPFLGLLIFFLIGSPKLPKHRRAQQRTMDEFIRQTVAEAAQSPAQESLLAPQIPARYEPFVRLNANLGHFPAFAGNAVELLPGYQEVFERIARDIDHARHFVHLEYFSLSHDKETEGVFTALERAVSRGVKVRVLMDHLGSRKYPNFKQTRARLEAAGIEQHLVLPLHFPGAQFTRPDLRNHRKIVVIDGTVGFTGSQNLIKRNYFRKDVIYFDELVARVSGPVVTQLEAAFITDWYAETDILLNRQAAPETTLALQACGDMLCQVLPSGSGFENENNLRLFTSLIHAAQRTLVITNPYFVPEDALMTAITSAAQRGVDVTLINSEASDQFWVSHAQRSYYEELLKAGVKIYWYPAPILLHAKHISIDDDIAVIGSSNLDIRSFQLNLEVTLVCYDARVVAEMRRIEEGYLHKSRPVLLDDWQTRSAREKLFENISRLTAALQ